MKFSKQLKMRTAGDQRPEENAHEHGPENPDAEGNPTPGARMLRCDLGSNDVAFGLFGIDLRGVNNRRDPQRQAAKQRAENRRKQIGRNIG